MPEFTLDHVVIAVRDLDGATHDYTTLLGRRPSWRGSHPTYGTRNTLYRIDNTYIELLSLGQGKSGQWAGELAKFLDKGEGLYSLALGTEDVAADVKLLRNRELSVQDPHDGDGVDEITGNRRSWRNAMVPVKETHGVRLFFIEHRSAAAMLPPAPIDTNAGAKPDAGAHVKRMDHAVVLSPDLEKARVLWNDAIGARLALDRSFPERNTRILFFRLGDITVEISGGAQQTEEGMGKPDRLWGVAWGVDNLTATVARLRARGVDVSEPRLGVKPGTLVATAKGAHTHGVATLLIEHTPESFRPESRAPHGAAYDNAPQRRAFNATGLDHVAIAVTDGAAAAQSWRDTLGIGATDRLDAPATQLRIASLPGGETKIALAQALGAQHPIAEWIAGRGPGMYAIAIQVDDIVAAVTDLRAKGITVGDVEYGAWPGTRVARIDRSAANGVSVQLVQRLPEVL